MSNFKPDKNVQEQWTSTRKANKVIGSNFTHPRLFSTVGYSNDLLMFVLAFSIELGTLFIAIFFSGFNPFLIFGASALMGLDLWFANLLHKNQKNINKFNCQLELSLYEERMKLKDAKTISDDQKGFTRSISTYENKKILLKVVLVLFAAAKAFFGFLVLSPYGMAVAIGVPAFFFIAAYIHINNTGYFFAERKRLKRFNLQEAIFIAENAQGRNNSSYGTYEAVDGTIDHTNTLVKIKDELEKAFAHLSRQPASGSPRYAHKLDLPGLRSWPLTRFPYLVFYINVQW